MATWKKVQTYGQNAYLPQDVDNWQDGPNLNPGYDFFSWRGSPYPEYGPLGNNKSAVFQVNCAQTVKYQGAQIGWAPIVHETGAVTANSKTFLLEMTSGAVDRSNYHYIEIKNNQDHWIKLHAPLFTSTYQFMIKNNLGSNTSVAVNWIYDQGNAATQIDSVYWPGGDYYVYNELTKVNGAIDIITGTYDEKTRSWFLACVPNYRKLT